MGGYYVLTALKLYVVALCGVVVLLISAQFDQHELLNTHTV